MATNVSFKEPIYFNCYKHMIVEEIRFIRSPLNLHYGLCSVIGKITFENHRYQLLNIKLSCFGKEHRVPTGAISILLVPPDNLDPPLPGNEFVEIFGEAIFWKRNESSELKNGDTDRRLPVTSFSLVKQLNQMRDEFENNGKTQSLDDAEHDNDDVNKMIEKQLKHWTEIYEPAIAVDSFKMINEAEEIITCNLELRAIQMKIQNMKKQKASASTST